MCAARVTTAWHSIDRTALRMAKREASRELPPEWLPAIERQARGTVAPVWHRDIAQREVWRSWLDRYAGAGAANLSDAEIRALAAEHALTARNLDMGEFKADEAAELARIERFCAERGVMPPAFEGLRQVAARVRCPYWWRRALRRMIARRVEAGAMALGLVSKPARAPYASNSAVWRRLDQNERNGKAAEHIHFENDAGQVASLADLSARSISNKGIRRGELMTRIRGCEEIADECGHVGVFLTLTCPSRFHSTLRDGRRNPKHGTGPEGEALNPRDAQRWLCDVWRRACAKMGRKGLRCYGLRVAEPHHDGCTHWHALLWFADEAAAEEACGAITAADGVPSAGILRDYWLTDADGPQLSDEEREAREKFAMNVKRLEAGGAAGYIAKYIAKNIDDHGTGGEHRDDYADGPFWPEVRPDLFGAADITLAMRVEAWASTWGVRQFQPIGQPPVGVWRELRRVREAEARRAGVGGTIHRAWLAAQRNGGVLADWARYVKAQGGMMQGRACAIRVRFELRELEGLYGRGERRCVLGVSLRHRLAAIVWSERRLWVPIQTSDEAMARAGAFRAQGARNAAQRAAPRTGVNNCTAADEAEAVKQDYLRGIGGFQPEKAPCEPPSKLPRRSSPSWRPPSARPPTRWTSPATPPRASS